MASKGLSILPFAATIVATPALSQDWQPLPASGGTAAVGARWSNGTGAVARCRDGQYQLLFTLLQATAGAFIEVNFGSSATGEIDPEAWRMTPQGNATFARRPRAVSEVWLRGHPLHLTLQGHEEQVLSAPGNEPALQAVLTACDVEIDLSLPEEPLEVVLPTWRTLPDSWIIGRYYPAAAAMQRVDGDVTLSCAVTVEGRLEDCIVLTERPANSGFGPAAVALTSELRVNPRVEDGRIVEESTIHFEVPFRMDPRFE